MTNKPQTAQRLDEVKFISHFGTVQCKCSCWADSLPCGDSEIQVSPTLWLCLALRLGVLCTEPVARQRENGEGTPTFKAPKAASDTLIPRRFHWQELGAWCHLDAKVLGNVVSTGQPLSNHNFPVNKRSNKYRWAVYPPLPCCLFLAHFTASESIN